MKQRDYARVIWWKAKTLGLMLVNQKDRNFFLHAVTLRTLLKAEGKLKLVKRKERESEKISTRNPGDIFGRITTDDSEVVIEFFFGEAERRIKIVAKTQEVRNSIDRQTFVLPKTELDAHLQSINFMLDQEKDFDNLWACSKSEIPAFYFDDDEDKADNSLNPL